MDPSTGTFTSMDTYAGSLSDPMSLHKYLFANSNPVMYSDPSGHMSKLAEQVVTIGIMATLGAEMNGILYVFKLEDNNTYLSKNDFFSGLFDSMFLGVLGGVLYGLLSLALFAIAGTVIATIILGVFGLGMSVVEIFNGILDYKQGNKKSGVFEVLLGIVGTILSIQSIVNGFNSLNNIRRSKGNDYFSNKTPSRRQLAERKLADAASGKNNKVFDHRTNSEVGRFIGDNRGNLLIEPAGGTTVPAGKNGMDTHTLYPNGSNYQRYNPYGHGNNTMPHGHGHLIGTGPGRRGQGPSIDVRGNVVPFNSPDAHWPIH